ncbi:uncharacterized protein PV07_06158 [Cladophialophora immunda]|uniref:Zn(2)-C6 fungal-type domain-containing protein n=1 Tax=Cladophialophora immunda TaxID=569365 RepID=A0A0D2D3Y1_9EURO|nr:uncharacterized protein PV07_06158 [Cladophialophora immunda]KIW30414.1 hypothetical protein PV07_06158 [Cladophialophora immunda]
MKKSHHNATTTPRICYGTKPVSRMASSKSAPPFPVPKSRNSRTKTGCLCCRLRRKKCDEATPVCNNCVRNNLICSWPRTIAHDSSRRRSDLGWRIRLQEGLLEPTPRRRHGLSFGDHPTSCDDESTSDSKSTTLSRSRVWGMPSLWEPALIKSTESQTLLSHFVHKTAAQLVATGPQDNPLLSRILPWAYSETMIMDAIMALGGAHVSHKTGNQALRHATINHYLSAMRKLKYALTKWDHGAPQSTLRLLTIAILLCQYEAVTCNRRSVAYYHLRACREFINAILEAGRDNLSCSERDVFGFLLEYYSYLAIVRNVTIPPDPQTDVVASDWFVRSLQHLQEYHTFGSLLGGSWELYELIPVIRLLHGLNEDSWFEAYGTLESKILNWSPGLTTTSEASLATQPLDAVERIYQIGVLTFLYSARYVKYRDKDEFCRKLAPIIVEFRGLCLNLGDSPSQSTLLWPFIVIGSCLTSPEDRQKMCSGLSRSSYDMAITQRAAEILNMTWELHQEDMYGPVALEAVMKIHDFCVS